jgi:hypothetical protein
MRGPSLIRAALLAAAVTMAMTSSALAGKPDKVPLPSPDPFFMAADTGFCEFDAELVDAANREFAIIFSYPNGSSLWRVAGSLEITATNLETNKSMTWNAGGPGLVAFDAQGGVTRFEGRGHVFVYGPLAPLQAGGIYEYTGNVDFIAGTYEGRRTDVCAALS